jgi:hypothetical protein
MRGWSQKEPTYTRSTSGVFITCLRCVIFRTKGGVSVFLRLHQVSCVLCCIALVGGWKSPKWGGEGGICIAARESEAAISCLRCGCAAVKEKKGQQAVVYATDLAHAPHEGAVDPHELLAVHLMKSFLLGVKDLWVSTK